MQRNENKLEKFRKRQEEIDKRLREAGVYEEGLSQEMKTQLLQFLEESYESARQKEQERLNLQKWEEKTLAEALCQSSTDKESGSSSSNSRKKEIDVEDGVVVSTSRGQHTQCAAESGTSASPEPDVVLASCPRRSVITSSSDHMVRLQTQAEAEDEDEDLVLLTQEQVDDPECEVIKTTPDDSPSTAVEIPQSGRRKYHESVKDNSVHSTSHPGPSSMITSPVLGKSRITPANTITSTKMAGDDCESKTVSPIHKSEKGHQNKILTPHVLLVPLSQAFSPRKNAILSPRTVLTSPKVATPAKKKLAFSHKEDASQNSTLTEKSPIFQKSLTPSPRKSSNSSGNTTTVISSTGFVSPNNLSPMKTLTPSKDASIHTPPKKSDIPNVSKNSATPSFRRNLAVSSMEDSSLSKKCTSASPLGASVASSAIVTTTITTTTTRAATSPAYALATPTSTTTVTSGKEAEEPGSPPDASPESDLEDKVTLRTAVLRNVNVFSRSPAREVILRRKRPLPSEAANKSFHQGPHESPQQCKGRIITLMDNMALRLQQHQSSLPALSWSRPLTVDWRLKHSLDRPRPVSRQMLQRQQLEEEERDESNQRYTRQAAKYSREVSKPLPGPSRAEGTTRAHRMDRGRALGLRGGKRPALLPLPIVTSDSDTDVEIGPDKPSLPAPSQNSPLSSPLKTRSTVLGTRSKMESQPQQRRKTFRLDSGSEGSDKECCMEADVARMDNHTSCVSPGGRDAGASPTNPISELCIIEDEKPHSKLARPAIRRVARRGTRRPAPEPTGLAPTKLRKTHTLNRENSGAASIPEQTAQLPPDSSDVTHSFEGANEWNTERRQNQEEEEMEEEEKMPCPICQRLYPLQEIEMHASDCMEIEDSQQPQQQEEQQQALTRGPRRLRRVNDESSAAFLPSSEESNECNKKQRCSLCKDTFNNPEDLQIHIQSCHKMEEEEEEDNAVFSRTSSSSSSSLSSSVICQNHKRKVKVFGRAPIQERTRAKGGLSQPGGLLANMEGKHSSLQP